MLWFRHTQYGRTSAGLVWCWLEECWCTLPARMSPHVTTTSMSFPIPSFHLPTLQWCQAKNLCGKTIRSLEFKDFKAESLFCRNVFIWVNRDLLWSFHVSNCFKPLQVTKIYKVMAALLDERLLTAVVAVRECQSMSKRRNMNCTCTVFNGTAAVGTASVEWCWMYIYIIYILYNVL